MDWDDLKIFLEVARRPTHAAAAESLRLSQPTVSRRLKALQEAFSGQALFNHSGGRRKLSELGRQLKAIAERMETQAIRAKDAASSVQTSIKGEVRITTVETLATRILGPAMCEFQLVNRQMELVLLPMAAALSLARQVDIAVRLGPFKDRDIQDGLVGEMGIGLYASKGYVEAHGVGRGSHFCIMGEAGQDRLPEYALLRETLPNAAIALRSTSRELQVSAAKLGLGVAAIPHYCADSESGLVQFNPALRITRPIWMGVHNDRIKDPQIRLATNFVRETLSAARERLNPSA
jgi:DNA-binding transcriptional LysR family regulator